MPLTTKPPPPAPPLPPPRSPASHVLTTPELLEAILAHLDPRTLLTAAQRVNRLFHALVAASPRLQEALFFRPRRPAAGWDSVEANALVFGALPVRFHYQGLADSERRFHRAPAAAAAAAGGPGCAAVDDDVLVRARPCPAVVNDRRAAWEADARFARPEASWRRMLAVQPLLDGSSAPWRVPDWAHAPGRDPSETLQRVCATRGPLDAEVFAEHHGQLRMGRVLERAREMLGDGETLFCVKLLLYEGAGETRVDLAGRGSRHVAGKCLVFLRTYFPTAA
ncbi:hypothetical protein JX265_005307 [Neoarthrinium moseri]|uniref:F-box domain-containing protein n=1 Tax=Neoarthrinium moseri TaxID=1658444 RepID=A0A9P9WP30_9PEZI|nr:hypothetical protein JX265_005307 [Neoarthrinium moseri]